MISAIVGALSLGKGLGLGINSCFHFLFLIDLMEKPLSKQWGKGMVSSGTADAAALCCFIQESDGKCGEVRGELYPPREQRGGFLFQI